MTRLWCTLLLVSIHVSSVVAYANVPITYAKPFLTKKKSLFGSLIEGASVDKYGNIYATHFQSMESALGRISNQQMLQDQGLFFKDRTGRSNFNGLRFLPTLGAYTRALAADTDGRVVQIEKDGTGKETNQVFCSDPKMLKTNDLAVAYKAGRIYTSSQIYTADTVVGDGDLWMCQAPASFFNIKGSRIVKPVKAIRLGVFGRTNGIEVSPDEKTLYLSEAFNKGGSVVSNKIWKFNIDPKTGLVSNKQLFVDFHLLDGTNEIDVDGMRADVQGNLFVTRNGGGDVLKFSPNGTPLLRIKLVGILTPTNLEFGGSYGKSLVIVGKCNDGSPYGEGVGCANVWHGNAAPGHAFRNLKYIPCY